MSAAQVDGVVSGASVCGGCGSTLLTRTESETFCSLCGLVAPDVLVHTVELSDVNRRGRKPGGVAFTSLPASGVARHKTYRLKRVAKRVRGEYESDLSRRRQEEAEASRIGEALGAPRAVVERALAAFRSISRSYHGRGRSTPLLVAVGFVVALREFGVPRTLREVAVAADLGPGRNVATNRLGNAVREAVRVSFPTCSVLPASAYLHRYLSEDAWTPAQREMARRILAIYERRVPNSTYSPVVVAIGVFGYVSRRYGPGRPLRRLMALAGVTEPSIRNSIARVRASVDADESLPNR